MKSFIDLNDVKIIKIKIGNQSKKNIKGKIINLIN